MRKKMFKKICLFLFLASCGFRPMYKQTPYNDLSKKTSEISIPPVQVFDGQYGVELRNNLLNKLTPFGKPENPVYILDISLSAPKIADYTIKTNGIASSRIVRMSAKYTFKKKGDAKVLFTKTATATSPYNLLNNQFSTEMLKNDAVKLSIEDISNQIYFAIITYFTEK